MIPQELIHRSEHILLPANATFDPERIDFINNMKPCDLIAVPGSGKTTVLKAKLYSLAKMSIGKKNCGILAIAHTNNAVNEIRAQLEPFVPQLFKYPNFVGTVQDFVDTFLAVPYYHHVYAHPIHRIDGELRNRLFEQYIKPYRNDKVWNFFVYKFQNTSSDFNLIKDNLGNEIPWNYNEEKAFSIVSNPPKTWGNNVKKNREHIFQCLKRIKQNIEGKGILGFYDCYYLAQCYISKFPIIIDILRSRFKFVFIDETQDLKKTQLQLIDKIFNCDSTILQRIGDINQAIFSRGYEQMCHWQPRNPVFLKKSLRLSDNIGKMVNSFTLDDFNNQLQVIGERQCNSLPPIMFIYDSTNKDKLLTTYESVIRINNLTSLPEAHKYGFHIIAWNISWNNKPSDVEKMRMSDFSNIVSIYSDGSENEKDVLHKLISTSDNYLRTKAIRNFICDFLRDNNVTDEQGRYITSDKILKYIYSISPNWENRIQTLLVKITSSAHKKDVTETSAQLNALLEVIRSLFNLAVSNIDCIAPIKRLPAPPENDLKFTIGSVHGVKGQTHCATLYIETMYEGKYESMHLFKKKRSKKKEIIAANPFYKERINYNLGSYASSAFKMIYVGMSRPTHLFCYAMHRHSFALYDEAKLRKAGWKIIDLSKDNPYKLE